MAAFPRDAAGAACVVLLLDDPAPLRVDDQDALAQAQVVERALAELGYGHERVYLSPSVVDAMARLQQLAPVLVFNLVESIAGVGGRLPLAAALVEALRLAVSGSGCGALAASTDKVMAKRVLRGAGLATPDWRTRQPPHDGSRWILKPVDEDASLGIAPENVSADTAALARLASERVRSHGGRWFFERYVDGREFNVALLEGARGFEALPVAEIRFDAFAPGRPRIVDYAAKWDPSAWAYTNTPRSFEFAPRDAELIKRIAALALRSASAFGLRGYARVDLRVDAAGHPWVLEVNANPCLSADAGFAAAAARAGISMTDVVARIVRASGAPAPARAVA
jgi:D-alanine-D-alanine ligase